MSKLWPLKTTDILPFCLPCFTSLDSKTRMYIFSGFAKLGSWLCMDGFRPSSWDSMTLTVCSVPHLLRTFDQEVSLTPNPNCLPFLVLWYSIDRRGLRTTPGVKLTDKLDIWGFYKFRDNMLLSLQGSNRVGRVNRSRQVTRICF